MRNTEPESGREFIGLTLDGWRSVWRLLAPIHISLKINQDPGEDKAQDWRNGRRRGSAPAALLISPDTLQHRKASLGLVSPPILQFFAKKWKWKQIRLKSFGNGTGGGWGLSRGWGHRSTNSNNLILFALPSAGLFVDLFVCLSARVPRNVFMGK